LVLRQYGCVSQCKVICLIDKNVNAFSFIPTFISSLKKEKNKNKRIFLFNKKEKN